MDQLGLRTRTIYRGEDLERASQAPSKIVGMYSSMKEAGVALTDKLDSGLGREMEDCELSLGDTPPVPPKLITADTDPELHDSGLGDEVTEKDHVAVETRSSPVQIEVETHTQPKAISGRPAIEKPAPIPRRPWKNIAPGRSSTMQYSPPSQPSSATTTVGMYHGNAVPAQAEEELQRQHLQNQWQRILFQQQLSYLLPNQDGDTGIHLAVIHTRPDILTQLLALVATDNRLLPALDEQNRLYQTALHLATHIQQVDMIQKLLAAGASPDLTDHKGNTPLHIACKFSSTKCLDEIVRGVPLNRIVEATHIRNHQGQTCVHVATERGNTDTLRKLKSIGIDMNVEDFHSGRTALHLAVEKCSLTDVQFLTETCQVDVNKATYSGCTPLHIAAGRGNIAVVAYLLSMGADPDLQTDEGDTALDLAGSDQVATILTKAAALRWLND